jgi:phosphocarrier protein HPr
MSSTTDTHRATVKIVNRLGLHARPAMALVDVANRFESKVSIQKGDETVDGKSIMQVMMLAATQGTQLEVETTGPDAGDALAAIQLLIKNGFDEE